MILSRLTAPPGPFPFVYVLHRLKPTFNVGKIIRTANAFGAHEVHLIGIPLFNPKPCLGTLKQTRTKTFETFEESYEDLVGRGYRLYALDPTATHLLGRESLAEKSAFIIGHEEFGIPFKPGDYSNVEFVKIAQFGKVQSLNASVAASVAGYEYLRQQNFTP
jgi:tRNA G18 (ribose-2'-O)-methylase SpoU